ncbi:YceI family protein [Sphingomonas sp. SUN019]|uniref:YceI family protein n=1 Tax=Sphingomonas sp. SUN019 TaxID=2937788 RepID=UPI0021640EF4|nr:YceI family protein [Sphingomonas sp. SUN019]UVO52068.1 YceI family protein [Sphingomonas sp. SUN019]
MRIAYAALLTLSATALPLAALTAQGAPTKPGSKNPAAITGGTYTADSGHSLVKWTVDHLGFTPYYGIFGDVAGTLTLDPKNPNAAKVDVTIPVSKVTTASAGLTSHLLKPAAAGGKPDFFGPAPADAKFVSTRVVASGETAKITGNLTLNGVTKPVTLDAAFYGAGKAPAMMGGKENVGFTATTTIKRSDFGVAYGIPMVSDEVKLDIVAAFQK